MDWMTFVAEITKAIAWPAIFAVMLFLFHRHVRLLLVVAIKSLRRLRSLKYGALELAVGAVEAAAEAKEEKADAVTQRIATENLTQEQKEALLEELKESTAEAERLRNLMAHASPDVGIHSLRSRHATQLARRLANGLRQIVAGVGPDAIRNFSYQEDLQEIRLMVGRYINEARSNPHRSNMIPVSIIEDLIQARLLDAAGPATMRGAKELVEIASHVSS